MRSYTKNIFAIVAAPVIVSTLCLIKYAEKAIIVPTPIHHWLATDQLLLLSTTTSLDRRQETSTDETQPQVVSPLLSIVQPRDFVHFPITHEEHEWLEQHQQQQLQTRSAHTKQDTASPPPPPPRPRIALCHPTIHKGDSQTWDTILNPIFAMVSYYRLLGVSHLFFWYEPNVAQHATRWKELVNATAAYTTFTPITAADMEERYHGQEIVQQTCIEQFANDFDWILINDADEFFWWSQKGSLIDFVETYRNYSYISLGKYMYTMLHQYQPLQESWPVPQFGGIEMHPFTAGSYCYQQAGKSKCPAFTGRCKLLIRPHEIKRGEVSIHGRPHRLKMSGTIHLDTSIAHWKEWVELHNPPNRRNITVHYDQSPFYVSSWEQVHTHLTMESHPRNEKGQVKFFYDDTVNDWLSFVARGCPSGA